VTPGDAPMSLEMPEEIFDGGAMPVEQQIEQRGQALYLRSGRAGLAAHPWRDFPAEDFDGVHRLDMGQRADTHLETEPRGCRQSGVHREDQHGEAQAVPNSQLISPAAQPGEERNPDTGLIQWSSGRRDDRMLQDTVGGTGDHGYGERNEFRTLMVRQSHGVRRQNRIRPAFMNILNGARQVIHGRSWREQSLRMESRGPGSARTWGRPRGRIDEPVPPGKVVWSPGRILS